MMSATKTVLNAIVFVILTTTVSKATITNYSSLPEYFTVVGPHQIIYFTELAVGTVLSDQYVLQSVTFADGDDVVYSSTHLITDGVGVNANGRIDLLFSTPQTHIGVEFPGAIRIEIYNGATLIGTSIDFAGSGEGFFGGIVSTEPFNRAVLLDWADGTAYIDNLYYEIPEPGTILLVGLGGLALFRKRRA
jgi:hypothetical protein